MFLKPYVWHKISVSDSHTVYVTSTCTTPVAEVCVYTKVEAVQLHVEVLANYNLEKVITIISAISTAMALHVR